MRSTRAPDAHARRSAILSEGSYAAAPIAVLSFAPQMTEPDAVRLDKWLWAARRFGAEPAQDIRGRPTKRDGRRLRDLPSD